MIDWSDFYHVNNFMFNNKCRAKSMVLVSWSFSVSCVYALVRSVTLSVSVTHSLPPSLSLCVVGRPTLWDCAFPETLQFRHRHNKSCCEVCINTCQHWCIGCWQNECSLDKPVRPWSQAFSPLVRTVEEKASACRFDNTDRVVRDKFAFSCLCKR